jgi:hypothetical protein
VIILGFVYTIATMCIAAWVKDGEKQRRPPSEARCTMKDRLARILIRLARWLLRGCTACDHVLYCKLKHLERYHK